jgi:Immunity protein 27
VTECRCETIRHLEGAAASEYANSHLKQIKVDLERWQTLFQCPNMSRFWKEYFLFPEAQGGGIPNLIQVSDQEAYKEFNLDQ